MAILDLSLVAIRSSSVVAHTDQGSLPGFVGRGNNLLSLFVNVHAKFFDGDDLGFALSATLAGKRLVLNRDGWNPICLVLPRDSDQTPAHTIHITPCQAKNLGETQKIWRFWKIFSLSCRFDFKFL